MLKYFYLFIFFFFITSTNANNKENIINNLKNTVNVNFEFEQNNSKKIEKGKCIVKYPKKIFCEYEGYNNKILVSNGKSLVIKTKVSYFLFPLKRTPLNLILDKNFLIDKIYSLEEKIIDGTFISFSINENDNEINIFFDNETFNLVGWKTRDIYQNTNITYLSSIETNKEIAKNLFKIPSQN